MTTAIILIIALIVVVKYAASCCVRPVTDPLVCWHCRTITSDVAGRYGLCQTCWDACMKDPQYAAEVRSQRYADELTPVQKRAVVACRLQDMRRQAPDLAHRDGNWK